MKIKSPKFGYFNYHESLCISDEIFDLLIEKAATPFFEKNLHVVLFDKCSSYAKNNNTIFTNYLINAESPLKSVVGLINKEAVSLIRGHHKMTYYT